MSLSNFRGVAGDTLPFAGFILDPGIGPTLVPVDARAIAVDTFARPRAGGNGGVAIDAHLHVADAVRLPLAALQIRKQLALVVRVAAHVSGDERLQEHGLDCGSVTDLGGFSPFVFERGYG